MSPVLSLSCDNDGADASWSITVPQNVTITGYSYTVMFSGDEEELSDTVGPDVMGLNIPSFGEVVTVTVVAHYRVVGDATVRDTVAATASCGIPNPITNLMVTCEPDQTGTGAIATASWTAPVAVSGLVFLRYEYTWYFTDEGSTRSGQETTEVNPSVSTQAGDYIQGETARFEVKAVYLDTNLDPDADIDTALVTANVLCPLLAPTPILTVVCSPGRPDRYVDHRHLQHAPDTDGLGVQCPVQRRRGRGVRHIATGDQIRHGARLSRGYNLHSGGHLHLRNGGRPTAEQCGCGRLRGACSATQP